VERAQAKIEQVPAAGPRQDRDEQEEEGCAGPCVIRFPLNFPPKKNISKKIKIYFFIQISIFFPKNLRPQFAREFHKPLQIFHLTFPK